MPDLSLAPASLPSGLRVYAVGDVHGCLEQLVTLHRSIATDIETRPIAVSLLIHLGDYVDRGPASAGVVCLLSGYVAPRVSRRVDLKGNHEVMMLAGLSGEAQAAELWIRNGGDTTLDSYGARRDAAPEVWTDSVPLAHRQWLRTRELTHREGGYLFVHAGIRPGRTIHEQSDDDLLWIREPFLSSQAEHPLVVVHGHTPSSAPEVRSNRIGIDTGAVLGGSLTCVVLEENGLFFLTA